MIVATKTINPFWDEVKQLLHPSDYRGDMELCRKSWEHRDKYCRLYSWAVPDPDSLASVAEHLGPCAIEIGAGTGYWAWQLSQLDMDILAYDIAPPNQIPNGYFCPPQDNSTPKTLVSTWYPVDRADASVLGDYPDRTLFLCWPPYDDPMAAECLKAYRGHRFVYIGEDEGGCTGDDEFFKILEQEWCEVATHSIVQWCGLNDYITVYERKESEEAHDPIQ